ncbi:MAG TPA: protein-disulfide reductase DsbD [Rudaea sp.]|nr:protein-disulfide reductase DsbD [Rudaea sp.]
MNRLQATVYALVAMLGTATALAAEEDNLLPVEEAFKVEAHAVDRGTIKLDFEIADDYYLYRERMKTKSVDASVTLGALDLPAGEKKHDEFLGDVEVYHHGLSAMQHLTAPASATKLALELRYQGCHQVDPKICFPPQKVVLNVDLPAAAAGASAAPTSLSAALAAPAPGAGILGDNQPLPPEQAFVYEAIATSANEVLARFTMPKGYYLYRDKTSFRLADSGDGKLGPPRWPAGQQHTDENFGATTVYFNQVEVPLPVSRSDAAARSVNVESSFQGCKENSVCYPLMTRQVRVDLPAAGATASSAAAGSPVEAAAPAAEDFGGDAGQVQRALHGSHLAGLFWFFVFGLGLAFTPCVFPMIPILSGIIAGAGDNISTRRAIVLSVVYILANAAIFTLAGVIAGLAGKNLQAAFQTPWVLWSFAGLFVLLSLSMFGFYELQLPSSWQSKIANVSNTQSGGSLTGVAVMGALSALIVGPCVTPPLAAAVIYIAEAHDPVFGGAALFSLALGMGAPLIVFGASAGKLLPRAGAWMDAVKAVFGVTFLGLAIWMLSRILDGVWIMLMSGALAVACAVYLGALERLPDGASGWRRLWKALGVVLLIAGAAELVGAAAGSNDLLQPLRGLSAGTAAGSANAAAAELPFKRIKTSADVDRELAAAKAAGKPVMLDFYADWCVSCKEMEKFTFSKTEVRAALAGFVLLQADVTKNDDDDQALMRRYHIVGPPDTLFYGADGGEKPALQLAGFEETAKFLARVAAATK